MAVLTLAGVMVQASTWLLPDATTTLTPLRSQGGAVGVLLFGI